MKKSRKRYAKHQSLLDTLRLSFDRLLLRGLHYRLIFAAATVVLVAVVGGFLMWLLDPSFDELTESVWWAFLRLTDPGYLGDDEGVAGRTISTVITVLGFLLFLGLLIAILTQWMNEVIGKIEAGVRPLRLRHHVLILGHTHRTPNIVIELLKTQERVTRFLEKHQARQLRIVMLDEDVNRELTDEYKERLGPLWDDRTVMLRSGSPLKFEHLEKVSFEEAAAIILPGEDFSNRSPGVADADTLKTLLAISRHAASHDDSLPLAVAALYDENRSGVARRAYGGEAEILTSDRVICRFIAQSVRQVGMWTVISQLLTINEGNALYLGRLPAGERRKFGEISAYYASAIPIGYIPRGTGAPTLNPDPSVEVTADDLLVFIAPGYADCASPDLDVQAESGPVSQSAGYESRVAGPSRILVLGWSRKVPQLLREFMGGNVTVDVVGLTPLEEREAPLSRIDGLPSDRFRQIQANFLDPVELRQLAPWEYDEIIILARARMGDEAHADAATITTYLTLQELLEGHEQRPGIFAELLEQQNASLFDDEHDDVLVGPTVISFMLSQIALRREMASVFAELCRVGGPQIELRRLNPDQYPDPVGFAELSATALQRGDIALGLMFEEQGVLLNPDRSTQWKIQQGDQLVILTTNREP